MNRQHSLLAVPLAFALVLSACTTTNTGPKETAGTFLGAGLGALAGSQVGKGRGKLVAVALGTLIGAGLGNEVGKSLDRADQLYMTRTSASAFESNRIGQTSHWHNPDSGNYGTVTPTRTYQSEGRYCREFQQSVTIGGNTEQAYGTACRQEDGSWEIV
ncbi:MAG: RT0821/Lpp0805 family surface protein [Alphaproteobacteria bacterium]